LSEAGCKTVFSVFGRDRFQNPSSEGTLYVVTQPLNRPPADLEIVDAGNGSYLVTYTTPPESGIYALTVTLEGRRHIYNSPFTVFVDHGPLYVDHCSVGGRGLIKGGRNLPMRFCIQTADMMGNALQRGGHQWKISVKNCWRQ
jgi:hypothetical protein